MKSDTSRALVGNVPLTTPETLATPATVIVSVPTLVTLAMIGSLSEEEISLNSTKSLIFTNSPVPGNSWLVLLIVLIVPAPEAGDIVATPTLNLVVWITSAQKVLIPTTPLLVPHNDFTLDIPNSVTATATLPLAIPLKVRASFLIKLPEVSVTVKARPDETAYLKNPVAPLLLPLINVPAPKVPLLPSLLVGGWFIWISVIVWISYKDTSHSFKLALDVL